MRIVNGWRYDQSWLEAINFFPKDGGQPRRHSAHERGYLLVPEVQKTQMDLPTETHCPYRSSDLSLAQLAPPLGPDVIVSVGGKDQLNTRTRSSSTLQ
jgi:hypothetical protein